MKILLSDIHWGIRKSSQFYLNKTIEYFNKLFDYIDNVNDLSVEHICKLNLEIFHKR